MADAPKFDIKMLIMPAVMFMSKKIDFKDPNIVQMTQSAFVGGNTYSSLYFRNKFNLSFLIYSFGAFVECVLFLLHSVG